jgi:flagellar L-ring protein precursor FlgH
MKRTVLYLSVGLTLLAFASAQASEKDDKKKRQPTALEEFLENARKAPLPAPAPGASLFSPNSPNAFLFRDVKAHAANDIVTIQIVESSAATNSANTATNRKGDVLVSAPNFFGLENGGAQLNFSKILQGSTNLNFAGTGTTSRSGSLEAWLTARVCEVLPNGDLVIEGTKDVTINRERQTLRIRGVVRQRDVTPNNVVLSTAIAHMEVQFDGKGIVTDANKPGWLFWLFNKILPF